MSGISETSAARLLAPVLDRLRTAVGNGSGNHLMSMGVPEKYGMTPRAVQLFAMLRNAYPARAVPLEAWRAVYTYLPPGEADDAVQQVRGSGLVLVDDDEVVLSDAGRALMLEFHEVSEKVVRDLWGGRDVSQPLSLADRALAAALEDPGPTLSVMAPPYDAPDASPASRLAERLTGLRFSRFDSHIAAWSKAGATATTVDELPADVRAAVEQETNERAGVPYAVLAPDERLELLGSLAALRG